MNNIINLFSSKSNIVIVGILLAILSVITTATYSYLDNSITEKKIHLAKLEIEKSKKEADRKIAKAPFEAW